ncbi:hypothetical protein FACS189434_13290 [Bacteroidia bacterium]|nr:hypothetical protein FACS189434_13290 [Bacteroidia bacterium]
MAKMLKFNDRDNIVIGVLTEKIIVCAETIDVSYLDTDIEKAIKGIEDAVSSLKGILAQHND